MTIPSRFLACFLALLLILSTLPVCVHSSGDALCPTDTSTEPMLSEETLPEETFPAETQPGEILPDKTLSAETLPEETQPSESLPPETVPEETLPEKSLPDEPAVQETSADDPAESVSGPGLFFGLLNGHTTISEGSAAPEEMYRLAAQLSGMDFFAVSDHSDSFDNHTSGSITAAGSTVSADWAAGKAAASAASTASFTGLFGYELNWPSQMKLGHISTFGSPGFQSWTQVPFSEYDGALEQYYEVLASVPEAVSQFCHPGTQYGTFDSFRLYSENADRAVTLLELDFTENNPLRHYIKALDQGWHVAPTAAHSIFSGSWLDTGVRTAVYAQSLREADLLAALKQCRAYATEDPDLEILYFMDGYPLGSRLDLRHTGETADISVSLHDPTDSAAGLVEVMTSGGEIIAQQTLSDSSGTLVFSFPSESGYYFLRITQPDGDMAVTAPVWIDPEEELGIVSLSCETAVPVQNEPVCLTLELTNGEDEDFLVDSLGILADGQPVTTDSDLTTIPARSTISHRLTFSCSCAGVTRITLQLSGTLNGSPRSFEAALELSFRQSAQVTAIAVDGSHGNAGLTELNILKTMAMDENIRLSTETEEPSAETLRDFRFLLISAPTRPFSDDFLAAAADFAGFGGSIVLCGQAHTEDNGFSSASELNRLLDAIDSDIRIRSDTAHDPVNNTGSSTALNSDQIDRALSWCAGISRDQVYRAAPGCTIDSGSGTSVVTGRSTTQSSSGHTDVTLMACQPLSGGGTVFAAGCLFLSDDCLAEPENIWDAPYANRTMAQNLLGIGGDAVPLSTIQQARQGPLNALFRIRGYVTAGTSNPYNTFPDTLYLQDDTGGIAVVPFTGASIQQGTPVEVTGFAGIQNGSRVLKLSTWKVLDEDLYQHQPLTGNWETLLDPALNGGRFIQVEGKCREIYCREDDTLAGCLLTDDAGNTATVRIEDQIRNGSDGGNTLHKTIRKNRVVRAMGLLHTDEYGNTVVRVRNCEEVVWVPPLNYVNPKTGDSRYFPALVSLFLSTAGLALLRKKKRA